MSVFVAWMPDEDALAAFAQLQAALAAACPGANQRWRPSGRLHMTLRYLGERVDEDRLAAVLRALVAVAAGTARFELQFDRIEYWPQAKVLVAVPAPSRELADLFGLIEARMQDCGFAAESRLPRPHVTLAYLPRPPSAPLPAPISGLPPALTLEHVSLMRSGGGYESLGWFPLQERA